MDVSLESRVTSLEKLISLMRPHLKAPMHGMSLWSNIEERSIDPEDPPEGFGSLWLSDGTEQGNDGDLIFERTAGGVTKAHILGSTFIPGKYTSTSWDGDAHNANETIDLSATFGVPAGVKAVAVRLAVIDETTQVTTMISKDSSDIGNGMSCITQVANGWIHAQSIVPCDSNGDIYWWQNSELDSVGLTILGYWS